MIKQYLNKLIAVLKGLFLELSIYPLFSIRYSLLTFFFLFALIPHKIYSQACGTIPNAITGSASVAAGSTTTLTAPSFAGIMPTGGTITTVGTDKVHTFTSNTSFVTNGGYNPGRVEVLLVGGGGGGGTHGGGGGGGGGYLYITSNVVAASAGLGVVIGPGGLGATIKTSIASNGTASTFNSLSATGGGGGQSGAVVAAAPAANGGSGGGGAGSNAADTKLNPGTGAGGGAGSVQGFNGGTGIGIACYAHGAGGGGAGGAGANGTNNTGTTSQGGNGGVGLSNSISGAAVFYAGGGGGGSKGWGNGGAQCVAGLTNDATQLTAGTGGNGGGGAGGSNNNGVTGGCACDNGTAGTANTGGGGGGGGNTSAANTWLGGAGGSGIVIISYPDPTQGTWSSDNIAVATVNSSTGVVTGVACGTCNIIYTYGPNDGIPCTTATKSFAFTVTAPAITAQPAATAICVSTGSGSLSVTATGSGLTYQWRKAGVNLTNVAPYTNVTTSNMTITNPATGDAGNYDVVISGCTSSPSNTVAIAITAANTAGAASSSPTLCINTALTNITHTTTGATGISNDGVSGGNSLPAGVSAHWAANVITISGTPTASGTFNYSIPLALGCGSVNATGTIIVNAISVGGSIAGSATVCFGTNSTGLTLSGQTGSITRWESSTASNFSVGPTTIANTTTSLTATNLTTTTYYRAVITNGACALAYSSTSTITMTAPPGAPGSLKSH